MTARNRTQTRWPMFCAVGALAAAVVLSACSTTPQRIESLEQARTTVRAVEAIPRVGEVAPQELDEARKALARADGYAAERGDLELIEHQAYLATRHAQTARALVDIERYQAEVRNAEAERQRVQIELRDREAAAARLRATSAEERATSADQRAVELEAALDELQAKQTERGMVLTLGDVLFEVNRAELKAGAMTTVDRLAAFMRDYPERRVLIEGHTDSQGSDEYNLQLSERRAAAVRDALLGRGTDSTRVAIRGRGESYPVATNDSAAGRQQNRRVEIVISDQSGQLPSL